MSKRPYKTDYKKTPIHRARLGVAMKGNKNFLNHKVSPEHAAKISASLQGHTVLVETRKKIAAAHLGRKHTPETRAKMRASAHRGAEHPNWRGGIDTEPYAWTFNAELKEEVRRRDGYKCQLCGVPRAECKTKLPVHHCDYDKKNSDPVNLVTLCFCCHARTNNNREHWRAFFQTKAISRSIEDKP